MTLNYEGVEKQNVRRIRLLFPASETEIVAQLLREDCRENLPFGEGKPEEFFERIHCAVLKLSGGDMGKLYEAIGLAQTDWRDLLVEAGFGEDTEAHKDWMPQE